MTASAGAKQQGVTNPSRREMLNYLFGASMALALAGSCGAVFWFSKKFLFRYGEESGYFLVDLTDLPTPIRSIAVKDARAFLSSVDGGLMALYSVCPARGCLVKWSPWNWRFECPCCGSKFTTDGTYIEGPARRGLDRLPVYVITDHGRTNNASDGAPLSIDGATRIVVDANREHKITGAPRPPYDDIR